MPTDSRPQEFLWWLKRGRGFIGKKLPSIDSVEEFEIQWVQWWLEAQPNWRDTQNWPLGKGEITGKDWGDLLDGGKDGIYLVIVSLAWWIHARDSSSESKLNKAIEDVSWVLNGLLSSLTTDAATRKRHPTPATTGRAKKRARLQE
jgi:hypothetical protein